MTAEPAGTTSAASPAGSAAPPPTGLRRDIGRLSLLFAAVGSIIGSGWLLAPMTAAQIAGPASLVSWAIGAGAILILALVFAELGAMLPLVGGVARYPHLAHGSLVGFAAGWLARLGFVTTAPIEVLTALQYSSNYAPWVAHVSVSDHQETVVLSGAGYVVAALLMLVFAVVNVTGVRWLARANTAVVWWKIAIPVLAAVVLIAAAFHPGNLHQFGGFSPSGIKGILTAVASGGVIFSYTGFEQGVVLAGESRNPGRNVPRAVIGSVLLAVCVYVLLELAFVGAVDPHSLGHGWGAVDIAGNFGPFAAIASGLGFGWLATLLYIDSTVSPGAEGLLYIGTSARTTYAMSRNGYLPYRFSKVNKGGTPSFSIGSAFVIGMIAFLPFPSWQSLVGFISSSLVLMYALMPLCWAALRRQLPDLPRPFRLPLGQPLAFLAFYVANLVVYWSGWQTNWKLFTALLIGFALLTVVRAGRRGPRGPLDLRAGWWLAPYFGGLALLSWLGTFGGGRGVITFGPDAVAVLVLSGAIWWIALRSRLDDAGVTVDAGEG
ncbi:APC family permease [Streptomyces sp. S1D4-11]